MVWSLTHWRKKISLELSSQHIRLAHTAAAHLIMQVSSLFAPGRFHDVRRVLSKEDFRNPASCELRIIPVWEAEEALVNSPLTCSLSCDHLQFQPKVVHVPHYDIGSVCNRNSKLKPSEGAVATPHIAPSARLAKLIFEGPLQERLISPTNFKERRQESVVRDIAIS